MSSRAAALVDSRAWGERLMPGRRSRRTLTGVPHQREAGNGSTQPVGWADALAGVKRAARATWAAGDFPTVAQRELWGVGERLVRRVGIGADEDVLDVACGSGNAAIRAAQADGRVVGLDLTPELFDAGRRLARDAGVTVDWVEGAAEGPALPGRQLLRCPVHLRSDVRAAPSGRRR
jgi:SAM-dependent methyltransferase